MGFGSKKKRRAPALVQPHFPLPLAVNTDCSLSAFKHNLHETPNHHCSDSSLNTKSGLISITYTKEGLFYVCNQSSIQLLMRQGYFGNCLFRRGFPQNLSYTCDDPIHLNPNPIESTKQQQHSSHVLPVDSSVPKPTVSHLKQHSMYTPLDDEKVVSNSRSENEYKSVMGVSLLKLSNSTSEKLVSNSNSENDSTSVMGVSLLKQPETKGLGNGNESNSAKQGQENAEEKCDTCGRKLNVGVGGFNCNFTYQELVVDDHLYLMYEEVYFLVYALRSAEVVSEFGQGSTATSDNIHYYSPLSPTQLLAILVGTKPNFRYTYAAYHYYRAMGWVVRNGCKFSSDFVLYKVSPMHYHSQYFVIVTPRQQKKQRHEKLNNDTASALDETKTTTSTLPRQQKKENIQEKDARENNREPTTTATMARKLAWSDILRAQRIAESVKKTCVILQVGFDDDGELDLDSDGGGGEDCFKNCEIVQMAFRRFVADKIV